MVDIARLEPAEHHARTQPQTVLWQLGNIYLLITLSTFHAIPLTRKHVKLYCELYGIWWGLVRSAVLLLVQGLSFQDYQPNPALPLLLSQLKPSE